LGGLHVRVRRAHRQPQARGDAADRARPRGASESRSRAAPAVADAPAVATVLRTSHSHPTIEPRDGTAHTC
jgi:hypothetical protein